jgi:hypothetical protein
MKLGAIDHPKMKRLARCLAIPRSAAVGIMECLWHFTAQYATQGDIGKLCNEDIAEGCYWEGDADKLVEALTSCGWLDVNEDHRLIVHDWASHCDDYLHARLARQGLSFADGTTPSDRKLSQKERAQRQAAESGTQKPPSAPCQAKPRQAKARRATPEKPPAPPATAENKLAQSLAEDIGKASKKPPTADEHAQRVQVLSDRIEDLGPEQVEAAVRWWLGPGREESPTQFSRILRFPDAFAVKGDADRIEEALRNCSGNPDPPPAAPIATPEQIFDVEFDAMRRSHLNYLRKLSGNPDAHGFDEVAKNFAAKHGIEKSKAALEWIMRDKEAPELKSVATNPALFTIDLLHKGLQA